MNAGLGGHVPLCRMYRAGKGESLVSSNPTPPSTGEGKSLRVEFAPESVSAVRRGLQAWMGEVDASSDAIEDARLVASELVTNAIRHASPLVDGTIEVAWARRGGNLELSVSDGGGPDIPYVLDAPLESSDGRGLGIVSALAERWWVTDHCQERTVHALLPLND